VAFELSKAMTSQLCFLLGYGLGDKGGGGGLPNDCVGQPTSRPPHLKPFYVFSFP